MSIPHLRLHDRTGTLLRRALVASLIIAALAAGYGLSIVRATHSDPNVIHLCVSNFTSQVRYVPNPALCANGFVIDVNKQGTAGPQGPAGPPGPLGPIGPQGVPGQDGVSGYEIVEVTEVGDGVNAEVNMLATANCPAGKQVLGGGASPNFAALAGWSVTRSLPLPGGTGWEAIVGNINAPPTVSGSITVWAICADVTP